MDDPTQLRLVFDPGRDAPVQRERVELEFADGRATQADLYWPTDVSREKRLPFVLFVPGDGPQAVMDSVLDWGQYRAWGEAVAARGMAAVVAEHASTNELRRAPEVLTEVRATLEAVRRDADEFGLDPARAAVWTASGGASYGAITALLAVPPVSALVVYYGILDIRGWAVRLGTLDLDAAEAASAVAVAESLRAIPPTLLVTAGKDNPGITATADQFETAAAGKGDLTRLHHPTGQHAFDILDDDPTSADIIAETVGFLARRLGVG